MNTTPFATRSTALLAAMVVACLLLLVSSSPPPTRAQAPTPPPAARSSQPSLLVLRIYYANRAEYTALSMEFGLEQHFTPGGFLWLEADQPTLDALRARGLRAEIDQAATNQARANPPIFGHNPYTFFGGYYTVEEMEAFLDARVAQYPSLAQKVDFGDSWCKLNPGQCTQPNNYNGYDLWAMRVTNRDIPGPKPVFWFNAGLHSRELVPPELAIRYISWLLDGYSTNPDARWLVDHHDIWIVPMSNPDGHHIVEAGSPSPFTQRKNANKSNGCSQWPPNGSSQFGTDLNRNFPFLWGCCGGSSGLPCSLTYRGPQQGSEPETQAIVAAVRALIPDQRGPDIGDAAPITTTGIFLDMHSAAALTLYPWGQTYDPAPNSADLRNIAKHMSAPSLGGNGYHMEQSVGLYPTDGASDDWEYGELGGPGFTVELHSANSFTPPYTTTVPTDWNANRGLLIYLSKIVRQPYLLTRGPDTNSPAAVPMTATQGTPVNLTAAINYNWSHTDPPEANTYLQNVAAAEYYIDTPPWAGGIPLPMSAVDGAFDSPTEAVEATVDTTSLAPGRHLLLVRGRGVNSYQGFEAWGTISAAFLDILPSGGATVTPTSTSTAPPTFTFTPTRTPTHSIPSVTVTSSGCFNKTGIPVTCTPTQISTPNTPTATPTVCLSANYVIATGTATIVPGSANTGNSCDDCITTVNLPFAYSIYNTSFVYVRLDSNGRAVFGNDPGFGFECIPVTGATFNIFLDWTDLRTDVGQGCAGYPGGLCGIFTSVTGSAPNRIFNIEWRTIYFDNPQNRANFELRLYEGQSRFDVVYGTVAEGNYGVAGVQRDATYWTSYFCFGVGGAASGSVTYTLASSCATSTPTRTPTQATATPTSCAIQFTDVDPNHTFYPFIRCLACRGIINGYASGCATGDPCFRPENNVTRGQVAKIVSNAAGFSDPPTGQQFEDVAVGSTFYEFVYRLSTRGIINGYGCGGPGEPCVPPLNLPYFRPNANVTRGQLAKMDSEAAGYSDVPSGQQFEDVAQGSTFYTYTYRLIIRAIMSGYPCGGAGEPCNPPLNLPYFRPGNPATRGQTAKIVANTFYPNCITPQR